MNYEQKVKEKYPEAVAKHWMYDNGGGYSAFWVIVKSDDFSYNPLSAISHHAKTKKIAWQLAYNFITNQTKNNESGRNTTR